MSDDNINSLRDGFLAAQLAGDRRQAVRLLVERGLEQGISVRQLQLDVVQEAQREIGRLWQQNTISIAQEHMATAISQLALANLLAHAAPGPSVARKILIACVEGEYHDFPARIAADVLELAGFDVRSLGANVPSDSLLSLLKTEQADLLALSVTMTFNLPALRSLVPRVRMNFPKLKILVGGHACGWVDGIVEQVGADGTGGDARQLTDEVKRLLEVGA